jgi:hypothetical protein
MGDSLNELAIFAQSTNHQTPITNYGRSQKKTINEPAASAPRLQQRAPSAPVEQVPAVRRTLCAASRLSRVRILQGPSSFDRHGRRIGVLILSFEF